MRAILWVPVAAVLVLLASPASAVTLDQVLSLAHAGVTDAVILALIDRDRTIFAVEPEQIVALQREGLSGKKALRPRAPIRRTPRRRSPRRFPPVPSCSLSATDRSVLTPRTSTVSTRVRRRPGRTSRRRSAAASHHRSVVPLRRRSARAALMPAAPSASRRSARLRQAPTRSGSSPSAQPSCNRGVGRNAAISDFRSRISKTTIAD